MSYPNVIPAGSICGETVKNPSGEKLGTLKELVIDVNAGRIAYAVLSFGGLMGLGDKLFAIPWDALEFDVDHKCLILNVSKEQLDEAEGFDKDQWPDFANIDWHSRTYAHYGYSPYWEPTL